MSFEVISVIGLGYIGLPTAAMFASKNKKVIGVDIDHDVVNTINAGQVHFIEPELRSIVASAVSNGNLEATSTIGPADAFIIAVPTPLHIGLDEQRKPNTDLVDQVIKDIAPILKAGNLVILESTCPVGTTDKIVKQMANLRPDLTFCNENSKRR